MSMPENDVPNSLARRRLLRGGTLALGAAGAAVAMNALNPTQARAADGEPVLIGEANTATSGTALNGSNAAEATLSLSNDSGAGLRLVPTGADPTQLSLGDMIGRSNGPDIVVDYGNGPQLTYLATGLDLQQSIAFSPMRVMDTRKADMRASVVAASSSSWFDSSKRVKAGAWIDIALAPEEDGLDLHAVYVNVTVTGPSAGGNVVVYPSGTPTAPSSSNLNYAAKTTIANLCFVEPAVVDGLWCVRVKVNAAAAHVIMDFSGVVGFFPSGEEEAAQRTPAGAGRRVSTPRGSALRNRFARGLQLND